MRSKSNGVIEWGGCTNRDWSLRVLAAAGLSLAASTTAFAQTTLPGIVVTSPSPVVQQAPSPSPSPEGSETAAVTTGSDIPPGILIVVEDAFVPVTVTTDRELVATQGPTITDTLQQKPGIIGSTFAAGANRPIIRGLDNARVRVQENGIGTHDVSSLSEDHAVPVDPNAATRVEVIRGPATLRYGSQAIGGVVSVENDRIPSFMPKNGFKGSIQGGLSSVDQGKDGAFSVTAGAAGIVVHADAFARQTEDYSTPQGKQFNSFVESNGFSFGASTVWNNGFVGISYTRYESLYGISGGEASEKRVRIDLEQDKIQAKGEFRIRNLGIEAVRFWMGFTEYVHDEVLDEDGSDIIGVRFTNQEAEARVEVQHLPIATTFGKVQGAIGLQGGQRETYAFGVDETDIDALLDPARTRSIAGFIFEELEVNRQLRFQVAGRVERSEVKGNGITDFTSFTNPTEFDGERSFTPVSGSVGVLYKLPLGIVSSLTLQHVERAPEAQELYSKGVHEATETFEIGNPFLETEKGNSVEFGLKKAKGPLRFDSSLYYTRYDSFIFKQIEAGVACGEDLASCEDPDEDELQLVTFQQRKATFYGFEIAAQYDVAPIWNGVWGVDGQYDFVRAKFEGDNVPRIPPHRLGGGLFYRDANLFARVGVLHAFDQDKVNAESEEMATTGYTLVNAELSYTSKLSNSISGPNTELTVGIKGENLADDEVRNHTSFKSQDILLPGASVRVFGKLKFN